MKTRPFGPATTYTLFIFCVICAASALTPAPWAHASSSVPITGEPDHDASAGPRAPWDTDPDADVRIPNPASGISAAATPSCLGYKGSAARQVEYTSDGVIHVAGCGEVWTLSQVYAALPETSPKYPAGQTKGTFLLQPLPGNEWLLRKSLKVEEGARLNLIGGAAGDVAWLKLLSTDTVGVFLRAENSTLRIQKTKITSWDDVRNAVDTTYTVDNPATPENEGAGRSYISTRSLLTPGRVTTSPTACAVNGGSQDPYEGRMDIIDSEIGYLGYKAAESWGTSWKVNYKDPAQPNATLPDRSLYALVDVFGSIVNSRVHDNYFGAYTFGAYCMTFTGSEYDHNAKYGLDPHDDSDYLLIDDNVFHHNGSHGVICSQFCNNIQITNNIAHDNIGTTNEDETEVPLTHGIMIHRSVSHSLIADNTSYGNNGGGIAVFESFNNVIRNNTVYNNGQAALRLSVGSRDNLFENNTLTGPPAATSGAGYVLYSYKGSDAPATTDGLIRNNTFRNNTMRGYKTPVVRLGDAVGNVFENNTISGPGPTFLLGATENLLNDPHLNTTRLLNTVVTNDLAALSFALDEHSSLQLIAGGLRAHQCYAAFARGKALSQGRSNTAGQFAFSYDLANPNVSFTVQASGDCGPVTYLPLLRR